MGTYSNVWDALYDDDKEQALNLQIRSDLMIQFFKYLKQSKLTQNEAAEKFGISQPRLSNLTNGMIDKFTIDCLVNILSKAGIEISFTTKNPIECAKESPSAWRNFRLLQGGKAKRKPNAARRQVPRWDVLVSEPAKLAIG